MKWMKSKENMKGKAIKTPNNILKKQLAWLIIFRLLRSNKESKAITLK